MGRTHCFRTLLIRSESLVSCSRDRQDTLVHLMGILAFASISKAVAAQAHRMVKNTIRKSHVQSLREAARACGARPVQEDAGRVRQSLSAYGKRNST